MKLFYGTAPALFITSYHVIQICQSGTSPVLARGIYSFSKKQLRSATKKLSPATKEAIEQGTAHSDVTNWLLERSAAEDQFSPRQDGDFEEGGTPGEGRMGPRNAMELTLLWE